MPSGAKFLRQSASNKVVGELSVDRIKVHKLAVRELPRSGKPGLLAKYGIDANGIVAKVKALG